MTDDITPTNDPFGVQPPPPQPVLDLAGEGSDLSYVSPSPQAPKRKTRVVALAVGLVAAVGAGGFAFVQLSDKTDGADTPRAAVNQMVNAINSGDVLGVLEALPPGERSAMVDPIKDINDQLQRVGIVAKNNNLKSFQGAGIKIAVTEAQATNLGSEVASVDITKGTVESSFDLSKLPIGDELKKLAYKDGVPTSTGKSTSTLKDGTVVHLMTIKEGGGWHVSLFYTLADALRRNAGKSNPEFGKGIAPVGADTPEGAVKDMLNAVGTVDVKRLIELLPPDEMRVMHDYAPLFLDNTMKSIADFKKKNSVAISFNDSAFSATKNGDVAVVKGE